jgi:hypothetical protein
MFIHVTEKISLTTPPNPKQRFSTDVPLHTGVTRRVRGLAGGVWGRVKKKIEIKEE